MIICREIRKKLKPRPRDSHKGDFGKIFILAGSKGYAGAAHLAAMAALRGGAGLVTLGVPEEVYPVLARREAEVMVRPFESTPDGSLSLKAFGAVRKFLSGQDILALGPGLGQNPETRELVRKILAVCTLPTVIDADGLNALNGCLRLLEKAPAEIVLTPHPGEFKRLFGGTLSSSFADRKAKALLAAASSRAVVVLKGDRTVVASPDGKVYVNSTGNPGMATGGSGDVLTGLIAALLGQKLSGFDAARFGVFIHGLAGDLTAAQKGEISLIAGDLIDFLPLAFQKILGPRR